MSSVMTVGRQIAVGVLGPYALLIGLAVPYLFGIYFSQFAAGERLDANQQLMSELDKLANISLESDRARLNYLASGEQEALEVYQAAVRSLDERLAAVSRVLAANPDQSQHQQALERLSGGKRREVGENLALRRKHGPQAAALFLEQAANKRQNDELQKRIALIKKTAAEDAEQQTRDRKRASATLPIFFGVAISFLIGLMTFSILAISRRLNRNVGAIVQHVQSSAAELKSSATLQQRGAKGQASTATEVATTMHQLVASSRQIADSAQRVNVVAKDASSAAHTGDSTVLSAQSAVTLVRQQVDRIVSHMVDLGKRTQEIGSILDIINELAEQTNILAINATIEAAGAGDTGRRFAVVADEIRKLADRVGGSTKEVRDHIDKVRDAATTTVMVTEDGSKAVESSTRQFEEVAVSFRKIVELIGTTAGAVHEIELSTKQQTTAVGQVSTAIGDVAKTARETEQSSGHTLRTAEELITLSGQLLDLVRRSDAAPPSAAPERSLP